MRAVTSWGLLAPHSDTLALLASRDHYAPYCTEFVESLLQATNDAVNILEAVAKVAIDLNYKADQNFLNGNTDLLDAITSRMNAITTRETNRQTPLVRPATQGRPRWSQRARGNLEDEPSRPVHNTSGGNHDGVSVVEAMCGSVNLDRGCAIKDEEERPVRRKDDVGRRAADRPVHAGFDHTSARNAEADVTNHVAGYPATVHPDLRRRPQPTPCDRRSVESPRRGSARNRTPGPGRRSEYATR